MLATDSDRRVRQAGRNRSRSPTQIDRYQPDRSRDDYYRGREDYPRDRRRSSPQIQPGPPKNIDTFPVTMPPFRELFR
jgi:hypothetical protein